MTNYNIFCTKEQTRKAIELGAPIEVYNHFDSDDIKEANIFYKDKFIELPDGRLIEHITAEQMIGWLEEQGLCIEPYRTACGYLCTISKVPTGSQIYSQKFEGDDKDSGQFTTRGKATIAAIDKALEYLSNNK